MSWKGLVKAIDRGVTKVMQSTGAVETTVDKDYEMEEDKLRKLEIKLDRYFL